MPKFKAVALVKESWHIDEVLLWRDFFVFFCGLSFSLRHTDVILNKAVKQLLLVKSNMADSRYLAF